MIETQHGFSILTALVCLASCAYFNTFYNAEKYFQEAEKEIRRSGDETKLNKKTMDALDKAIEKSSAVLKKYPDSRFRDDALLLRGKALFYRGDYSKALESFERVKNEETESPFIGEAEVRILRCVWKLGDRDKALHEMKMLLRKQGKEPDRKLTSPLIALVHETTADIHLERGNTDSAIYHLAKSAEFRGRGNDRSRLYFRIGELAMRDSLYHAAEEYYQKVIHSSTNSDHVEKSKLQIVKITRIQKRWEETTTEIQKLLSSEKFTDIRPELYLELAKLYEMRSRINEAINRLELITEEFPRTETSAEAYCHLGRLTLETGGPYEQARKYYEQATREARSSSFAPSARIKVKEINAIIEVKDRIGKLEKALAEAGSSEEDTVEILHELARELYSYGELLAFHFDRADSGIGIFERLVEEIPSSPKRAQALFSLAHLYQKRESSEMAEMYARQLVMECPLTEFAEKVSASLGLEIRDDAEYVLQKAEELSKTNLEEALQTYHIIVEEYPSSRFVPVALLAMAAMYDRELNDLDNSLLFYGKLLEEFPESDQARYIDDRYRQLNLVKESLSDTARSKIPDVSERAPEREN